MKKPLIKMSISVEDQEPTDAVEIQSQKPVAKEGEDGIGETKPLTDKNENSIETALQAPKGEDNTDAKGIPDADALAKAGAKEGVPEIPRQEVPAMEGEAEAEVPPVDTAEVPGTGVPPASATDIEAPETGEVGKPAPDQPVSTEPDVEAEIEAVITEADVDFDAEQEEGAAIQRLESVEETAQNLIDTDACTEDTLELVEIATSPAMESLGIMILKPSMESYGKLTIKQKHQVAVESISGALKTHYQTKENHTANVIDSFFDAFRSVQSEVNKYEKEIQAFKAKARTKQDAGKGAPEKFRVDTAGLWQFFSTDKGQVKNFVEDTKRDVGFDKAILVDYAGKVVEEIKKLDAILKKTPADINGFKALFNEISQLPVATKLFPRELINGKPLFGVVGFENRYGSARNAISVTGTEFPKLAELATANDIKQTGSVSHGAKKAASNIVHGEEAFTNKLESGAGDVVAMLDLGQAYLNNVKIFTARSGEVTGLFKSIQQSIKKITVIAKGLGSKEVNAGLAQVDQAAKNIIRNYKTPAAGEVSRALRGAKFSLYAAKTMFGYHQ